MFVTVAASTVRHGGIVFRHENGTVETIEGNVSDVGSEGVMVAARRRRLGPTVTFGHLPN
jgi:hypothetical protein